MVLLVAPPADYFLSTITIQILNYLVIITIFFRRFCCAEILAAVWPALQEELQFKDTPVAVKLLEYFELVKSAT